MSKAAFYCVANWKMNKGPGAARDFVRSLLRTMGGAEPSELVLLPSALSASVVADDLKTTALSWGGQNCYSETQGAFTGENSPQVLAEMGAKFCLVGHSERRHVFAETDEMLRKKIATVQAQGLTPIFCVGETMDDRRWNRTQEVVLRQLKAGLQQATPDRPLWLAYEPVWAIGTGQVATTQQVEEVHDLLRRALRDWNHNAGERMPILYGGSVKPENAPALATLNNVNGFLIGGASLDPDQFLKIYHHAKEARGASK